VRDLTSRFRSLKVQRKFQPPHARSFPPSPRIWRGGRFAQDDNRGSTDPALLDRVRRKSAIRNCEINLRSSRTRTRSRGCRLLVLVSVSPNYLSTWRFDCRRAEPNQLAGGHAGFPARSVSAETVGCFCRRCPRIAPKSLLLRYPIETRSRRSGPRVGTDVGPARFGSTEHFAKRAILLVSLSGATAYS
jgi:hypothetical protein